MRTLILLGIAVTAGIFLLLYLALKSGRDAALVMLVVPALYLRFGSVRLRPANR